jgi:hypothetical protein
VEEAPVVDPRPYAAATLIAFEFVVLAFVAYHFVVGGIPLLSANVEVERFDFTGSGLFGLPGRMYLFGLPFLVIFTSAHDARQSSRVTRSVVRVAWVAYALAQILAGFKGSLLAVLLVFLLVRAIVGRPLHLRAIVAPRYVAVGLAGLAFALLIAFQYGSLHLTSPSSAISYLGDRLTVIAAEPGYVAMAELGGRARPYLLDDFIYAVEKYTRIEISNEPTYRWRDGFSAKRGSPRWIGACRSEHSGAFPGWYVDIGWLWCSCCDAARRRLYAPAHVGVRAPTPLLSALWGFEATTSTR